MDFTQIPLELFVGWILSENATDFTACANLLQLNDPDKVVRLQLYIQTRLDQDNIDLGNLDNEKQRKQDQINADILLCNNALNILNAPK